MPEMRYEALEPISREDALAAIRGDSDAAFGRGVVAAAVHSDSEVLDELFVEAARHLGGPERARMLCAAISTAAQARRVVPTAVDRVLAEMPWRDDARVASARDEALEIVALVRQPLE